MNTTRAAPDEVLAPPGDNEAYLAFRAATDLRTPYRIHADCLRDTQDEFFELPETPFIAFINARSGGRVGPRLATTLCRALGKTQVFDLGQYTPDQVLRTLWRNLDVQIEQGNAHAKTVRQRLRILAAGGDGTISWVLNTIRDLQLDPPPAVAIIPLGTGNDLSRSFGWGKEFLRRWISNHDNIYTFLKTMSDAAVSDLDGWSVRITLPSEALYKDKPHSLRVPAGEQTEGKIQMAGLFWNYFSVGLDAKTAFGFHRLREAHPWMASGRLVNQLWYSVMSCKAGWFCYSQPLKQKVRVEVQQQRGGAWEELELPASLRALVLLNLRSYAGGRNIWGHHGGEQRYKRPDSNDGMLEVVGFTNGWHTAVVMGTKGSAVHGVRLAQVAGVRMHIRTDRPHPASDPSCSYMQMDGEPWSQYIPSGRDEGAVEVEVAYAGTAKVLVNRGAIGTSGTAAQTSSPPAKLAVANSTLVPVTPLPTAIGQQEGVAEAIPPAGIESVPVAPATIEPGHDEGAGAAVPPASTTVAAGAAVPPASTTVAAGAAVPPAGSAVVPETPPLPTSGHEECVAAAVPPASSAEVPVTPAPITPGHDEGAGAAVPPASSTVAAGAAVPPASTTVVPGPPSPFAQVQQEGAGAAVPPATTTVVPMTPIPPAEGHEESVGAAVPPPGSTPVPVTPAPVAQGHEGAAVAAVPPAITTVVPVTPAPVTQGHEGAAVAVVPPASTTVVPVTPAPIASGHDEGMGVAVLPAH